MVLNLDSWLATIHPHHPIHICRKWPLWIEPISNFNREVQRGTIFHKNTGWSIYIWLFYYLYNFFVSKPNKIIFLYDIGTYLKFLKSVLILYFLKITSDKWAPFEFVHSASNVSWSINRADGCSDVCLQFIDRCWMFLINFALQKSP